MEEKNLRLKLPLFFKKNKQTKNLFQWKNAIIALAVKLNEFTAANAI